MCFRPRNVLYNVFLLAAFALASVSLAQSESFHTGSLALDLGGAETTLYTYATAVPEDAAERATSPEQRALLEKVAGTDQHSATFMFMEGMAVGGVQITPATIYVSLYFRADEERTSGVGGVDVSFAIDPETMAMIEADEVDVKYLPTGSSFKDYYALTQGELNIESVTVVDEQTLAVSGSFSGVFSLQEGFLVAHNPDDTVAAEASFEVQQVVGSDLMIDLLGGE